MYHDRTRILLPLLLLATIAATALAGPPSGEEIMLKGLEAVGGEKAIARHHNTLLKGRMLMSGIEMEMTTYLAEPNLRYMLLESSMIGKMESGCDGKVAWDLSMMQGASIKEGAELEKALFDAAYNPELKWRERYTDIDVQGEEELEGTACWKVVVTPKVGELITTWIDKETWLPAKTETKEVSSMGSISIVSYLSDYREVDGVKMPHEMRMVLMGAQEMRMVFDAYEFNVEIPDGTFDLPAEIKELVAAAAAE